MEKIKIKGTDDTPTIYLNKDEGNFYISGKSLPEDVVSFYETIFEWFDIYFENPLFKTVLKLKLEYFNTATSKILMDLFIIFEDMFNDGHDVMIEWYYPDDDEDVEEAGDEYADIVECPVKLIEYEYGKRLDFEVI